MSGECETVNMTSWEVVINQLNQLYMIPWEEVVDELYQLYNACKKRESQAVSEIVQQLKKRSVKFKLIVGNGTTTLHLMCFHGNLGMVKLLAEMYRNADSKDENQRTPLHLACLQGHIDVGQYLTHEQRCDLRCRDKDGLTPLHLIQEKVSKMFPVISKLYQLYKACKRRSFTLASSHLQRGMSVKFVLKDTNCTTTLHLICEFIGNLDVVKSLVEMYGNVEARDEDGDTPLHLACGSGCIDIVEYLVSQCGCDKEARNNEQYTPLLAACVMGQTDTVKYLVSRFSCKVDIRNYTGMTPLHAACRHGFTQLVQYLINDCGCSPEVKDDTEHRTPLHFACMGGHLEIVKYLASECKCNTEARDKFNSTPLYLACANKEELAQKAEIVSYLILEQGCNPEAETSGNTSPIFWLYRSGELSIIKCCVKLKKHNPKTWKSRVSYSKLRNMLLIANIQLPSLCYQVQSNVYLTMSSLYVACWSRHVDLVKFLVEKYDLDPMERPELIINIEEASTLAQLRSTYNLLKSLMTPLYQACCSGSLDILQYLISKCGPAVSNYYIKLMYVACGYGYSEIMKYLLKYSTPHGEDEEGNTLLHFATTGKNLKGVYEIVKILITSMSNLDQRNCLGETALHTVCKMHPCRIDIIELLLSSGSNSQISNFAGKTPLWVTQSPRVFKVFMRHSPTEVFERILSDDIDEERRLKLLQCLIQQHNWNPNNRTKNGDTALHLACKTDRLTTIKYIFSLDAFKYDPHAKNKSNQTPIELTSSEEIIRELIKHGSSSIDLLTNLIMDEKQILQLVKEINKDKLNSTTANNNNALHLACLTDRVTIVKYLLRESKIDVNAVNESEFSPIQLTRNSEIIKELIQYGANPTDLYSYCRRVLRESKPLQTTVKVFVLGDSNVGKSTLINSLKKEGWFNFFTNWSSTVADDTESGHGIITHDFTSKYCGQVTLYDFVGRRLFHESQSDLLRKTSHSPRVFLVVTNLSVSDEEVTSSLQYWLGFLEEMSLSDSELKNNTIVIGSNIDKCRNEEKRKANIIKCFLQERVNDLSNVDYHDFIALDCRSHSSSDITKLRRCLAKLCITARNPNSLAFNAHCFQMYILDRFKERVAVSVHEILNKLQGEEMDVDEDDPLNFLPQSDFQLENLCIELHNKSQILYLRGSGASETDFENSWIIIDKAALISQLFEAFESKTFKMVPANNGILSFSTISNHGPFKVYNSDMFVKFLCHLEYCKEISDQETLQAIANSASVRLTSERCFFFPALVENSAPEGIWDSDSDNFSYHCGWTLQCTNSDQFFTSKFLQTLILRVMFCNTYLGSSGASVPDLPKFILWKGGISWGNIFGAESLVEVLPNNKAVLFLMRCRNANLAKCMEHRSTIIHQIRQCAKEFCGNLKMRESLICPSLVKKYPICTTPILFDIKPLVFAVVNITSVEEPYASSQTKKSTIPIRDLLKFEPYFELSARIIQEICNVNNPRYISCLTDDFLMHFIQQIRKNSSFIKIITQILSNYGIMDSEGDNLLSKLREWRDTCHITYELLHKCIDQFSIFAGLNIVDMVPGLAVEEFSTPPSSPVLKTRRTARKITVCTVDSCNNKTAATDSRNDLVHGMQLGDKPKLQDLDLLKLRDGSELRIIESVAANWEYLAIRLGFEGTRISNIKRGAFFQPKDACLLMFIKWLNGEHDLKSSTWYSLIQCLEEANEFQSLARDVKETIMLKGDDTPTLHQLYLLKPGDGSEVKIIDTVADQWTKLACALGFDAATCESLAIGKASAIACKDMLTCWLKQTFRPATWDWLIKSLKVSGFTELANEVKKAVLDLV